MRVLITGARGQVGQELLRSAPKDWQVHGLSSSELDITDAQQVMATVQALQPQLIINTAAYTLVDQAESNSLQAYAVNQYGAANLAKAAEVLDCPLLHLSTDYVFSGKHTHPYTEQDAAAPCSVYGHSKWLGEQAVREFCPQHIILRTSWVFGMHGNNFVKTILRLGQERDVLSIVSDQVGGPTSTRSITQLLWQIAEQYRSTGDCLWGTYHFSGAPACSWYTFAHEIFQQATELKLIQHSPVLTPINSRDYHTPAKRPAYSVLDNSKIQQQFNIRSSDWKSELKYMLKALRDAQQ